jgi:hypothetical protein
MLKRKGKEIYKIKFITKSNLYKFKKDPTNKTKEF